MATNFFKKNNRRLILIDRIMEMIDRINITENLNERL
jgi:hypothetical protein